MQLITIKKLLYWGGSALLVLALPACADDTVQMVTYFPVPYAKYDNLYPQNKLDIGTVKNDEFELQLDSFRAKDVNLIYLQGGDNKLKISTDFTTTTATFGNTNTSSAEPPKVLFQDLYLKSIDESTVDLTLNMNAKLTAPNKSQLTVFGKELPHCAGVARWKTGAVNKKQCNLVCCTDKGYTCSKLKDCK